MALPTSRLPRLAAAGLLVLLLTACTGRGGGQLPPDLGHDGSASFGFSFSCQDQGGLNPTTGRLRLELTFTERSTGGLASELPPLSPFSIHGVADQLGAVSASMLCIGQNPPPGGNELIFLGRYRFTSGSQPVPEACAGTAPSCRFEVVVRDDDQDRVPSPGDFFSISLSGATALTSELDPMSVVYHRAGVLSSGNLTVD